MMNKININKLRVLSKSVILLFSIIILSTPTNAQNAALAKKILDQTANILCKKGGAKASFSISSPNIPQTSGTISIKGKKFHATTPQNTVWFDGKTQWTYSKNTNEVNISIPNAAKQAAMNPYTFINIYKCGYTLGINDSGRNYKVHLKTIDKKNSIKEMYITINKKSHIPYQVKMLLYKGWTTININDFNAISLPNSLFVFNSKDLPKAEIIDLR